jgi:hypothetical protein
LSPATLKSGTQAEEDQVACNLSLHGNPFGPGGAESTPCRDGGGDGRSRRTSVERVARTDSGEVAVAPTRRREVPAAPITAAHVP